MQRVRYEQRAQRSEQAVCDGGDFWQQCMLCGTARRRWIALNVWQRPGEAAIARRRAPGSSRRGFAPSSSSPVLPKTRCDSVAIARSVCSQKGGCTVYGGECALSAVFLG